MPDEDEPKAHEIAPEPAKVGDREPAAEPLPDRHAHQNVIPYATPAPGKNPGYIPVPGRWAIGCFGFIALSILWWSVGVSYFLPRFEKQWTINGLPSWVGFAGWCGMTAVLLAITLWLRLRHGYKGYGYGILTVLLLIFGCALLILSLCGPRFL